MAVVAGVPVCHVKVVPLGKLLAVILAKLVVPEQKTRLAALKTGGVEPTHVPHTMTGAVHELGASPVIVTPLAPVVVPEPS